MMLKNRQAIVFKQRDQRQLRQTPSLSRNAAVYRTIVARPASQLKTFDHKPRTKSRCLIRAGLVRQETMDSLGKTALATKHKLKPDTNFNRDLGYHNFHQRVRMEMADGFPT
jgi:hypothetical protein